MHNAMQPISTRTLCVIHSSLCHPSESLSLETLYKFTSQNNYCKLCVLNINAGHLLLSTLHLVTQMLVRKSARSHNNLVKWYNSEND